MLPVDLVLIRHGESEGNVAVDASKSGDDSIFTDAFRNRHSREFRLTDKGILQARAAGEWLKNNLPFPCSHFYVSDYIRAKETAALLKIPKATWKEEFHLRERDRGLTDNIPRSEERGLFPSEHKQYLLNSFLSVPAGGGESVPNFALRLKAGIIEHWARQRSFDTVLCVSHGHVMRALQLEIENLTHDDFMRLDSSKIPSERMNNCQILWYTRRDPDNLEAPPGTKVNAVRSVCPWKEGGDYGWRRITRKLATNEDLLREVSKYPRQVG